MIFLLRTILLLYPVSFRAEYGRAWMEAALVRHRRLQASGHRAPGLRLVVSLLGDARRSAPRLWADAARSSIPGGPPREPRAEQAKNVQGRPFMETLLQDLRFGARTLRKRPLFTLVAVATLGLGIGAATAIFSVVDGVLLRPPPFERPSELVSVWKTYPEWRSIPALAPGWDKGIHSYPGYLRWREGQTRFTDVAIHGSTARNFTGEGDPERLMVGIASSSLFPVLGVRPVLGRTFTPDEDETDAAPVAVLGYGFWKERFGGDPGVLGRTIRLDEQPFTIVGVLPPQFRLRELEWGSGSGDWPLWIPVGADGFRRSEGAHSYWALGRLAPGATIEQAQAEALTLIPTPGDDEPVGVRMVPWVELDRAGLGTPLLLLLGAAGILLLIGCGNVATLLLGEVQGRRHEMATRMAMGAGRGRLVRQLLTESVLLGAGGGALGTAIAFLGTRVFLVRAPAFPRLDQVSVNLTGLLFAVGVGILTGLLFGLVPAAEAGSPGQARILSRGSRTSSRRGAGLQQAIIASELALTVVLLVSGILLTRSLGELLAVDTGFDREHLTMVRTILPRYRYQEPTDIATQVERMQEALAAVPGVTAASATDRLPFYDSPNLLSYGIEGWPEPEGPAPHTSSRVVLPGFFETMGIRILEGRPLLPTDRMGSTPVAVISEAMARRHWPDRSPLGARILFGDTLEIVGVASDVIHESLDAEPRATMYLPFLLRPSLRVNFLVRTAGPSDALFADLKQAVWSVDPEAPITRIDALDSLVTASARGERFRALLILAFSISAILLAAAGVFGVTARSVLQRRREMGIRRALGADSGLLLRLGLVGTLSAGAMGVAIGLVVALLSSRLLQSFLFGVQPWDPASYVVSAIGLLAMATVAAWLPARRAAQVEPMDVLREE